MKVDELWKNDNTLLEINTGNGKQMLCAVQPEKSFNDGTWEKGDQVTVVQSATSDIESEMLGGLDADKVSPFPALLLLSRCAALIRRPP
jgi:hypothetical protein